MSSSLNQPSLLQFFRPQQCKVQENKPTLVNELNQTLVNELNLNKENDSSVNKQRVDQSPIDKKRSSLSLTQPRTKRRKLDSHLVVGSSDDEFVPPTQDDETVPPTQDTNQLYMNSDTCPVDDEVSNPGDVEDLIASLDAGEEVPSQSWFAAATQAPNFWPVESEEALTCPSTAVMKEIPPLVSSLVDSLESENDFDAKYNLYLNQVPIAKGPHGRFWKAFVEAYYDGRNRFKFPCWIDPELMRDHEGRPSTDPGFDCQRIRLNTKLEQEKMHFTPAMVQYWQFKQDHFNKMIFFKLGKFYEIFYTDACILQPICDLKWMASDEKAHVGFPETSLQLYARKVIDAGFAVTVVEQMETPGELLERSRTSTTKPKAVHREVCEIYTRGTVAHQKMIGPDPVYLMTIVFREQLETTESSGKFAFVLTDVSTSEIYFGSLDDSLPGRHQLRSLLAHSAPQEILVAKNSLPEDVLSIFQNYQPKLTYTSRDLTDYDCLDQVKDYLSQNGAVNPAKYADIYNLCETDVLMSLAMSKLGDYLKELLMDERVLRFANYQPWMPKSSELRMQLDAAAMNALELLNSRCSDKSNSLFGTLNHCCSPFGERLLRRWVASPLTDKDQINARLDVVEWFIDNSQQVQQIRDFLRSLPDLERLTARTCSQALQGSRGAVFFNNTADTKIRSFLDLLDHFRNLEGFVSSLDFQDQEPPERLGKLVTRQEEGGYFPNLTKIIDALVSRIDNLGNGCYAPVAGAFPPFDEAKEAVEAKKREMDRFLDETLFQEIIGLELSPSERKHVVYREVKFRYEVEVPESLWAKIESRKRKGLVEVSVTSVKKDVKRFHVPEIKTMVSELESLETKQSNELYPFMQGLFMSFNDHAQAFSTAVALVAEVDVCAAFAFGSELWQHSCRPRLIEGPKVSIRLRKCVHPVLARKMNSFVPNDIDLGDPSTTWILTGPNMGGKSTLSRQVALLVLMAQIGCFVPAMSMDFTPVDRIFARVGAHDAILEGKSTFYVELEETQDILKMATKKSLVIIDEFGRGTSTEEGAALAQATARYITTTIGAGCLFSTHFQEQLYSALHDVPGIGFWHMAAEVAEDIVFLYKVKPGLCPESHGLKVAKIAGVPESVLNRAYQVA